MLEITLLQGNKIIMNQKKLIRVLSLPLMLMFALTLTNPVMAMGGDSKGKGNEKAAKMEHKKGHGKMGGMHGSMGLSMTNVMPGKTMKFLEHFKKWIEITPEQEMAWGSFSKAIKLQATSKPPTMHVMIVSPIERAEMKIARAEQIIQMKKNTLAAYKDLLKVLDDQQIQLADVFLAKHMKIRKGMHKGGKKGMKKGMKKGSR